MNSKTLYLTGLHIVINMDLDVETCEIIEIILGKMS